MTEYLKELNNFQDIITDEDIIKQIKTIIDTCVLLDDNQLPKIKLPKLGLSSEKITDLLFSTSLNMSELEKLDSLLNNFRSYLSREYGIWSLPNMKVIKQLVEKFQIKKSIELMAGNALWSTGLKTLGVDVTATDSKVWAEVSNTGNQPWTEVENQPALETLIEYCDKVDAIIMSWAPNFTDDDMILLQKYRDLNLETPLILIGERNGATDSEIFWQNVKIDENLSKQFYNNFSSFDFIDERIWIVR